MSINKSALKSDLRVGMISFLALVLVIAGVVFAGGSKGILFQKTTFVKAQLRDVGGLKTGSSVTMGGMNIGRVSSIEFAQGISQLPIEVAMEIRQDVRKHIKSDSVPSVRTQGMLGDRYVDISFGTPESAPLDANALLTGSDSSDFDRTLKDADQVLLEAKKLLGSINSQSGTIGELFYNKELYGSLLSVTGNLEELLEDFKANPKKYVKLSIF